MTTFRGRKTSGEKIISDENVESRKSRSSHKSSENESKGGMVTSTFPPVDRRGQPYIFDGVIAPVFWII